MAASVKTHRRSVLLNQQNVFHERQETLYRTRLRMEWYVDAFCQSYAFIIHVIVGRMQSSWRRHLEDWALSSTQDLQLHKCSTASQLDLWPEFVECLAWFWRDSTCRLSPFPSLKLGLRRQAEFRRTFHRLVPQGLQWSVIAAQLHAVSWLLKQ